MLTACHPGVVLERVAYGFVSGGDQGHEFGPSGVVFGSSGTWMAANGATGELFRLHGTNAEAVDPLNPAAGVIDLTVGPAGELYGSRESAIVEIDSTTGVILRTVADGFADLNGLAADHRRGVLVVADFTQNAIWEVKPATGAKRVRALDARLGSPDGVVLDDESTLYVAGYESEHVLAVALDGSIKDLGHVAGGPDGVALGSPQGPLAGCLVINTRDGQVVARRSDGSTVVLASGGTPGDLLAVDQSGLLYVTQHEEVIRLGPAWFALQPCRYLAG